MDEQSTNQTADKSMLTRLLQVCVLIAFIMAIGISCSPHKYVTVPDLRPELVKINTEAKTCANPVTFNTVEMLPVVFNKVIVGNETLLTISTESVENLTANLSAISESTEDRTEYINYLRQCLANIADSSVLVKDPP